jgi:hypothetical protein
MNENEITKLVQHCFKQSFIIGKTSGALKAIIDNLEEQKFPKTSLSSLYQLWYDLLTDIEHIHLEDMNKIYPNEINIFNDDQKDFICHQIGEWYIQWKEKMWVDGNTYQYFLGVAKEQLKTMICGE